MRLRNILFAVLGVIVLAFAGLAVALAAIDLERFKGPLAEQVARATGRALAFNGTVSLRLLPRPSLLVNDVTLAGAPWGSRPDMLRIGTLAAEIELRPLLFQRALHVVRLELRDADLLLETNADGAQNWAMATPAALPAANAAANAVARIPTDAAGLPLIDEIKLARVTLTWRDARAGDTLHTAEITDLALATRPDGRLALKAAMIFRAEKIAITGDLDLPSGFLAPGGKFAANLAVTLPGTVVKLAGGLGDARAGTGLDLTVSAEAEPLASLGALFDIALPAVRAQMSARLQGDLRGTLRLSDLALRLGRSDLSGSATLALSGERPRITATLDSTRLDLIEAVPPQAKEAVPPQAKDAADAKTDVAPSSDATPAREARLFGPEPFDLAALRAVDADLTLRIVLLETAALPVEQVTLRMVLTDGDLAMRPYAFTVLGSEFAGDARLNAAAVPPSLVLDVAAQRMDVGRLLSLAGAPGMVEARGDLVLSLRGQGASPRALAASLDGNASLVVGQGTLARTYIDHLGLASLRTALPQAQRLAETRLNCAIARFDIARGIATAKLLAADAGDLSLVGNGTVNLGTETLSLDLAPRIKLAAGAGVVVPVQVRGTLLAPAVNVLSGRAGLRGNPLAALGGLILDPGASRNNPCGGLAEVPAQPTSPAPAPSALPSLPAAPSIPGLLRLLPR